MTPTWEDILNNGRVCCLLNLSCCIPPPETSSTDWVALKAARLKARAEFLYAATRLPQLPELPAWAWEAARNETGVFDLVPAGTGKHILALAEAYRENLEKTDEARVGGAHPPGRRATERHLAAGQEGGAA